MLAVWLVGWTDAGRLSKKRSHMTCGLRPEHCLALSITPCVLAVASFEIKQQTRSSGKAQIVLEDCISNDAQNSEEQPLPELCRQRKGLDATIQRKRNEKRLETAEARASLKRSPILLLCLQWLLSESSSRHGVMGRRRSSLRNADRKRPPKMNTSRYQNFVVFL